MKQKLNRKQSFLAIIIIAVLFTAIPFTALLSKQQQKYQQYAANTQQQPVGQSGDWNLIFADEFNETSLNVTKWHPNWFGSNDSEITKPVNGSEESCIDPNQVRIINGELTITAVAKNCN